MVDTTKALTWHKELPEGITITVSPCYDKDGVPHKYEGDCSISEGSVTFTAAPGKSYEGYPECMITFMYPVSVTNDKVTFSEEGE